MDALIHGGDAFLKRVQTIKAAKDAHDKAFEELNLGKSASAALHDAQVTVQNAINTANEIKAEADKVLSDAREKAATFVPAAQEDAAKIIADAKVEADTILARAQAAANTLNSDIATGRQALTEWSEKTKREADSIMRDALDTKASADRQFSDNQAAAHRMAKAEAQAKAATDEANNLQDQLTSKLDAIRAAAS